MALRRDVTTTQQRVNGGSAAQRVPRLRLSVGDEKFGRQGRTRPRNSWQWEHGYVPKLMVADAIVALLSGAAAYAVRFGVYGAGRESIIYLGATFALPLIWVGVIALSRAYEPRFLGVGSEEFRRVMSASVGIFCTLAVVSLLFKLSIARGYLLVVLPVATLLTLHLRYRMRKSLHRKRSSRDDYSSVVAVGHAIAVRDLVRQIHGAKYHGMRVIAACVPSGEDDPELLDLGVDVRGTFHDVVRVVQDLDADSVAVLPCAELDGAMLRRLGWDLEQTNADLLVAPAVMEVVGPRISILPICGLPLLHVERPELAGFRRIAKSSVDRIVAAAALVVLALPLLALAVAIRVDSKGSPLFKQERVGRDGKPFHMYKLRTMTSDAEERLVELTDGNDGNGVLFKMKADPRITRIGRMLRRYSIDELPQLINVLRGEMSLVGPRPPLQREVELYGDAMYRRFLVKPGLTGLWQINGRSDLDWRESERLDVRYVENWSFVFDFMILWKTASVVLRGRGAY